MTSDGWLGTAWPTPTQIRTTNMLGDQLHLARNISPMWIGRGMVRPRWIDQRVGIRCSIVDTRICRDVEIGHISWHSHVVARWFSWRVIVTCPTDGCPSRVGIANDDEAKGIADGWASCINDKFRRRAAASCCDDEKKSCSSCADFSVATREAVVCWHWYHGTLVVVCYVVYERNSNNVATASFGIGTQAGNRKHKRPWSRHASEARNQTNRTDLRTYW